MRVILCLFITGILIAVFFSSCQSEAQTYLPGTWRIDSVYDYYNGFSYTNRNPTPREMYDYRKDSTVLRKGMGEQLLYRYSLKDSTLAIIASGRQIDQFTIIHIDEALLVLKKDKRFLFPGNKQQRYEVRYFTKIETK
jgi:hypothetical protein